MRAVHWFVAAMFGFFISGCTSIQTAPSPETRQALAPTGKLRVAFLAGPIYALEDPASGELKGVAVDLGNELARRLGVPFQPVVYPNPGAIIAAAKAGEWDVALTGINAERAAAMDFSAPYMEVEQTYLIRGGAPVTAAADIWQAGVRVGVLEKGGADVFLSGRLTNATLVRVQRSPTCSDYWIPKERTRSSRPRARPSPRPRSGLAPASWRAASLRSRSGWACRRAATPPLLDTSEGSWKRPKQKVSSDRRSSGRGSAAWSSRRAGDALRLCVAADVRERPPLDSA